MQPKHKSVLYKTDGTSVMLHDGKLTYEELKAAVGGMVEIVPMPSGMNLICNEEGKLIGLPTNEVATEIWRTEYPKAKYPHNNDELVVGDAIIAPSNAIE